MKKTRNARKAFSMALSFLIALSVAAVAPVEVSTAVELNQIFWVCVVQFARLARSIHAPVSNGGKVLGWFFRAASGAQLAASRLRFAANGGGPYERRRSELLLKSRRDFNHGLNTLSSKLKTLKP
jgi:hypothetical protein